MKTTFEKVRLWLYLPMMAAALLFCLYYTLTAPAGVAFDRFLASAVGLAPFGVFALSYMPCAETLHKRLPLISAGVHLATDVLFIFCARVDRPFGVSAWSYFRSVEFLLCVVGVIAALLLCSRKTFAVLTGVMSCGLLMTFHEAGAFRTAGFALQLSYFVFLILFAWSTLPETDGFIKFFGWLFEKDAEIEDDTPITERDGWPGWKYDAFDETEEEDDIYDPEEENKKKWL